MISLRKLIVEEFEVIGPDELTPEQYDQLETMRLESGIRILSDKELDTVYVIDGNVAAAMWISYMADEFSFDVIVNKNYRRQGLCNRLTKTGLEMYREIVQSDPNAKLKLDVVNQHLVEPLKKMGLKVLQMVGGHTLMGYGR